MPDLSLGLVGVGSFGELALAHLSPFFKITLHDPHRDLRELAGKYGAKIGELKDAAACDVVVLAVPVQRMQEVLESLAPLLKQGALVIDVASVKVKPAELMKSLLPTSVKVIAAHPLFGPQSGKNGIAGLNIVICPIRGDDFKAVRRFCRKQLGLRVFISTPEEHDREMAAVQGLTHLLSRAVRDLKLPEYRFVTKTYALMQEMVAMVGNDSDELFQAIECENPYAAAVKSAFFAAIKKMEEK